MIYAEKGNRVKQISESDISKYVEQGFKIIDDKGVVLHETIPTDLAVLKTAYVAHTKEIETLKAKVEELEAKLKQADKKSVKAETVETKVEGDNASIEIEDKPKRRTAKADIQ